MSKRPLSLSNRLLLASALLLPLFLGLTGLTLERAFQRSLSTAAQEQMQSHVYLLFSVAELNLEGPQADLIMPPALLEPDFERLDSGLYAYIFSGEQQLLWRSRSAELEPEPELQQTATQQGQLLLEEVSRDSRPYWRARYGVTWEDEAGGEHPFELVLLKDQRGHRAELASYRGQLWRWLVAAALVLLLAQSLILRWGLRPLTRLAQALEAMRRGDTTLIGGEHPRELQPVVDNLNQVLRREQSLRERYRDSLSNLAHSLKTPLAVLRGRPTRRDDPAELEQMITEQVARMDQVVSYQLRRAVSEQQQGLHRRTPIAPALTRLKATLEKVYRDQGVQISLQLPEALSFPGDEQDWMELMGNLLDNACKYGRGQVRVSAQTTDQGQLQIRVEDDGPGIPEDRRSEVLDRGRRLDNLQPGQGIGLAVAADIVRSYGGQLSISESSLGGTAVTLLFTL